VLADPTVASAAETRTKVYREQVLCASLEAASNQQKEHPQTRMVSMTDPESLRFEPFL